MKSVAGETRPLISREFPLPAIMSFALRFLVIFTFCAIPGQAREAGIPSAQSEWSGGETRTREEAEENPPVTANSTIHRSIKYAGKYHLLALHFPIAFLLAAALVQWHGIATGRSGDMAVVLLWFGTVGAVAAAMLGWMYAYDSVYFGDDEKLLLWHRWLGTGTASAATIVALARNRLGPRALGLALAVCAGLVAAAAHFGASLAHGADFLKKF